MTTYYLIRGNQIVSTIESTGVTALPLMGGGDVMSLLNETHAQHLMSYMDLTYQEALAALGLADLRDSMVKSVFAASLATVLSADVTGIVAYHLIDVDDTYSLWQCDGQQDDLMALHGQLWQLNPENTLGALAAVQTFGTAFYPDAVRTMTGMTNQQALARRDRFATYLESLGYDNTVDLRSATNEHEQMIGITIALGHTEAQLWSQMIE